MLTHRHHLVSLLSLVLLGTVAYVAFDLTRAGRKEVIALFGVYQSLLADHTAHDVEKYLGECAQNLLTLAAFPSVRHRDPGQMQSDFETDALAGLRISGPSLLAVDETGAAVFPVAGRVAGSNYAGAGFFAWARQPEHQGQVYVSAWARSAPPYPGHSGSNWFFIATPLWQTASNATAAPSGPSWGGVLVITVDLESILALPLSSSLSESKPPAMWIMDQDGTVLHQAEHPEMLRENIRQGNAACLECHGSFAYAEAMLAVKHGSTEYQLPGQPKKLAAFAPVAFANAAWIVVMNAPQQEITHFVRRSFQEMVLLMGLLAAAFGLAWFSVYRSFRLHVEAQAAARHWQEKHQLAEQQQEMLRWQQGINQVQLSLLAPAPLEDKLRLITDGIVQIFGADFCRVWLIRPGDRCERGCVHAEAKEGPHACRFRDRCLHLLASSGRYTHLDGAGHRRVPFGAYKIGRIASGEDHKFLTNDVTNEPRVHNHEWARELGLVSFAGYQLRIPGADPLGVLALFAKHPILPAEDALLDTLSSVLAQTIQQTQAEESLRVQSAALEAAANGIVITDRQGTIQWVNPAFTALTGYTAQDAVGQNPRVLKSGCHEEAFYRTLWQTISTGQVWTGELTNRRKDGSLYVEEMTITPLRDAQGAVTRYIAIKQDVTKRKQAEAGLRESEARLAAAQAVARTGSWETNLSTMQVIWSDELYRIFEVDPDRFPSSHSGFLELVHPQDRAIVNAAFAKSLDKHSLNAIEHRIVTPAGLVKSVEERWRILLDDQGHPARAVGTCQDITERKRSETELAEVQNALVHASRQAGMAEVATNVLHNVGNVLNSVNISTGVIVETVKKSRASSLSRVVSLLQEHTQDLGAFITQDARGQHLPAHLATLAEHLLAEQAAIVSELESLRRNVEHIKDIVAMQQSYAAFGAVRQAIDVASLVEDSLRLNEDAFSRHRVEVIREFEPVPPLLLEKHKLLQILVNLLSNAKSACDMAGRIDHRVTVRVANGDGRVRISVMDNGIGIPAENLTRIFNHGFTTRPGGHGFGLHSSALAAKELGGSLIAHSAGPGQGATFTLEMPILPEGN